MDPATDRAAAWVTVEYLYAMLAMNILGAAATIFTTWYSDMA